MRKVKFLKYPEFPGGKTSFIQYIREQLIYPEEATRNRVEGDVFLAAEIDDNGNIQNIRIEKGLGYGCDEEAVRLLHAIHFGGVSNPGIRLKTRKKFRIPFRLKKEKQLPKLQYSVKQKIPTPKNVSDQRNGEKGYSYTISWTANAGNPPASGNPE